MKPIDRLLGNVERSKQIIYSVAYKYKLQKEDFFQDVAEKVLKSKSYEHRSDDYFFNWLASLSSNLAKDHYRKSVKRRNLNRGVDHEYYEFLVNNLASSEDFQSAQIANESIQLVVDRMSDHYYPFLFLREYCNYSYKDISEYLNIPIGTVKVNICRMRKEARKNQEILFLQVSLIGFVFAAGILSLFNCT